MGTGKEPTENSTEVRARPFISMDHESRICHDYSSCRVVFNGNKISVGCSDITIEAAEKLLKEYKKYKKKFDKGKIGKYFIYQ